MVKRIWAFGFCFVLMVVAEDALSAVPRVILVDKATNKLKVAEYPANAGGEYRILKTYHTTVGRVRGDKEEEGDLKTPEGIYRFTSVLRPPNLKPKFGVMALYMDYPNAFDRAAGSTGYDIMLHATDEPQRLQKNFDSEGCIVVDNDELEEIRKDVRLGLTPILVFSELGGRFLKPRTHERLKKFFQNWIRAWEGKDIDSYVGSYHSEFKSRGMNRDGWRTYKNSLNQRYQSIQVNPENIVFLPHPKYSVVMFKQNYRSTLKSGVPGYVSSGTKILYVAEEGGRPRIIGEDFTQLVW